MKHFTSLGLFVSLFGAALGGCSGSSSSTVGGTADGVEGSGLVLLLNGVEQLPITASGSFEFATTLSDGDDYTVTVETQPSCPQQTCTVTGGTGTVDGDVLLTVSCVEPTYRLVSQSWGDDAVRVTDDLLSYADGATATPRIVAGAATELSASDLDSVAYDAVHDRIYAASAGGIRVFSPAATVEGDVAPLHDISVAMLASTYTGLEVDAVRDRLYATVENKLLVFDDASTLDGEVVPTATIVFVDSAAAIALDAVHDRLFVSGDYSGFLYVFDDASTLTSASTPDRTVTWTGFPPSTVAVDGCADRVYIASNNSTPGGFEVLAFDDASTLDGSVDLEMDSDAQLDVGDCITSRIDGEGRLYCWPDSATYVDIYDDAASFTGNSAPTPSLTVLGVVNEGYGMDVVGL